MIAETIKPIRSEADYKAALVQIDLLSDAAEGTEEFDRLDVLATLVEAYEAKHYPISPPSFEAAVEYEMEKRGIPKGQGGERQGQNSENGRGGRERVGALDSSAL